MRRILLIFLAVLNGFFSISGSANTILVLDKKGLPVKNAVVSIQLDKSQPSRDLPVAIMDQINRQFSPQVLVINKGQRVSFPNSDEIRHHVYSFSAIKPFEIRLYKGSSGEPIEFDKPGIGVLGCNIHDNMVGYIYVAENEQAVVTDHDGKATFDMPLPAKVNVWHHALTGNSSQRISLPVNLVNGQAQVVVDIIQQATKKRTFGSRKFGQKEL